MVLIQMAKYNVYHRKIKEKEYKLYIIAYDIHNDDEAGKKHEILDRLLIKNHAKRILDSTWIIKLEAQSSAIGKKIEDYCKKNKIEISLFVSWISKKNHFHSELEHISDKNLQNWLH